MIISLPIYYNLPMYSRSLETNGLDPIHYYSLPGLSWDAMLKYTCVELELITDPDMHLMVEKSMRGDISNICHRYATSKMPIRYTPGQCHKCFLLEALNGYRMRLIF